MRTGDCYFVSYRDPNLKKTLDVYDGVAEYLENFDADERAMTQYIIGAISELDTPLTPAGKALRSLSAYMNGISDESIQSERDELLATDCSKIRELAAYARALVEGDCLCVVGNENAIKKDSDLFKAVEPMFRA